MDEMSRAIQWILVCLVFPFVFFIGLFEYFLFLVGFLNYIYFHRLFPSLEENDIV